MKNFENKTESGGQKKEDENMKEESRSEENEEDEEDFEDFDYFEDYEDFYENIEDEEESEIIQTSLKNSSLLELELYFSQPKRYYLVIVHRLHENWLVYRSSLCIFNALG